MDIQLILGPNNSGKSLYAENMVEKTDQLERIYLATMIAQTDDNKYRIEKHIRQRAGKGFRTIEEPWDIHTLGLPQSSVVLLEDASNLLANGIFVHHSDAEESYRRICALASQCQKLIIVSISGLSEGSYDEETNHYIRQLNKLNAMLKSVSTNCIQFS